MVKIVCSLLFHKGFASPSNVSKERNRVTNTPLSALITKYTIYWFFSQASRMVKWIQVRVWCERVDWKSGPLQMSVFGYCEMLYPCYYIGQTILQKGSNEPIRITMIQSDWDRYFFSGLVWILILPLSYSSVAD